MSHALTTQIPTQQVAAPKRTEPRDLPELIGVEALMRLHAELRVLLPKVETDGVGFELPSFYPAMAQFQKKLAQILTHPAPAGYRVVPIRWPTTC